MSDATTEAGWDSSPDACLAQLTRCAQAGNVAAYVDCFDGSLREEIEQQRRTAGNDDAFATQLRSSVADLKGVATHDEIPSTSTDALLVLERIYQRHNERYRVALRTIGGKWRIAEMSRVGAEMPPVEYGTPVFALDNGDALGEPLAPGESPGGGATSKPQDTGP
ncbi:MAG TPA: hypothetical protein VHZ95_15465 [Polyangiales bacterium]|nr:hypothetical protein [Polyangiales bacterium]